MMFIRKSVVVRCEALDVKEATAFGSSWAGFAWKLRPGPKKFANASPIASASSSPGSESMTSGSGRAAVPTGAVRGSAVTDQKRGFLRGYMMQFIRGTGPVSEAVQMAAKGLLPWGAAHHDQFRTHNGRRIGLNAGQAVPIRAGGRLTGRLAGFEVGLLNIQTGEKPASGSVGTNFSAMRSSSS